MWILGLIILVLLIGFKGILKVLIGIFILYLIGMFCPILLVPILIYGYLKYWNVI